MLLAGTNVSNMFGTNIFNMFDMFVPTAGNLPIAE
jgi:hypothetical protein